MIGDSNLAGLVQKYQVCWEVWPEICAGPNHNQIGYEIELLGTDPASRDFQPSSLECARIRGVLETVASHVFENNQDVMTESCSDGHMLRYAAVRGNRPDVTFAVKILHRHRYDSPVDEAERAYLESVKRRLCALGACEHSWHGALNHSEKTIANLGQAA